MKRLILDCSYIQNRLALVEDGKIKELYIEKPFNDSIIGNIYRGRVKNVHPGMEACFIDIGQEKNAFYHYSGKEKTPKHETDKTVQVIKEPLGEKGSVVTEYLSFAGEFCVLIYGQPGIGISKKIDDKTERQRLTGIIEDILPEEYGVIVRTNGENKTNEDFIEEINNLKKTCEDILNKGEFLKSPTLLYKGKTAIEKAAEDLFGTRIDEFIINDKKQYDKTRERFGVLSDRIILNESFSIFEDYFIESQIEKALQKKVWLKSGGFIIIEQTEACVVIDVNTGKFTGQKNHNESFFKTNMEAAFEIASQIRLRNLYGMIVIDFISMKGESYKTKLEEAFWEYLKNDRVKIVASEITDFGLMQLTRKKVRESLPRILTESCSCCRGSGYKNSSFLTAAKIEKQILKICSGTIYDHIAVTASKDVIMQLSGFDIKIEKKFNVIIEFHTADRESYEIKGYKGSTG